MMSFISFNHSIYKSCPLCSSFSYFLFRGHDFYFNSNRIGAIYKCSNRKICGVLHIETDQIDNSGHNVSQLDGLLNQIDYKHYYTHMIEEFSPRSLLGNEIGFKRCLAKAFIKYFSILPSVRDLQRLKFNGIDIPNNLRILDYGAGSGAFSIFLAKSGSIVTGYEPDLSAGIHSRFDCKNLTVASSLNDINGKFDCIYLGHVLEHLDDPILVLNLLVTFLKDSGKIIIFTPNANSLGFTFFGKYWRGLEFPRHKIVFTLPSLINKLFDSGLVLREATTTDRSSRDMCFTSSFTTLLNSYGLSLPRRFLIYLGYFYQLLVGLFAMIISKDCGEELFLVYEKLPKDALFK